MKNKKIQIIIGLILFILAIIIINNYSEKKDLISQFSEKKDIKSNITCVSKSAQSSIPMINFSGRVNSSNKINIFSQVSGQSEISEIKFEVGEEFMKNDIIMIIKHDDISFELSSMKSEFLSRLLQVMPDLKIDFPSIFSDWKDYIDNYSIESMITPLPENTSNQQRNYLSSKAIFSMYYSIKSIEEKLDKFFIRAPFNGVLTEALVDPGSNVIMGQKIGQFIDNSNYEINTSVSLNESKLIKIGNNVLIDYKIDNKVLIGSINRIGKHINPLTQSIDIFININEKQMKDGSFISGQIICDTLYNINKISRHKLIDNDSIYVLSNDSIKKINVIPIYIENDSVIIQNLEDGNCIIKQYQSNFYNGMPIN